MSSNQQPVASSQKTRVRSAGNPPAGYRKLVAFQLADKLASASYPVARRLAKEDAWLASQLKRAALSAPLNIVEGHSRGTIRDFLKFLENANASLAEVEYLIFFIDTNRILPTEELRALEPIRKEAAAVLNGLMKSLHKKLGTTNDWQRTLVSDGSADYIAESSEHYSD